MKTAFHKFEGLDNPVCLAEPETVLPLMTPIFAGWPHEAVAGGGTPFASIGPSEDGDKWRLVTPRADKQDSLLQPVNAICDLICEMSWERLRSRPDLLCLHAAAVVFGNRLVIFPNQRRAGKSLLTATLARRGHPVFTDDFVPLAVDPQTRVISGVANGIAPRLRLPLPDTLAPDHAAWIDAHITTRNKQYGYLSEIDLPRSGSELPLGAIVMLDRDMTLEGPATLAPVSADEAFAVIMKQNFGRQVHAGAILAVAEAMTKTVPVLRMTYRDVEEAAVLLDTTDLLQDMPTARITAEGRQMPTRPAPLDMRKDRSRDEAQMGCLYARVPGYTEVETDQAIYLASELGLAIRKLNPLSMMIWKLLEEAVSGDIIVSVLVELFPDIPQAQLAQDVSAGLTFMLREGLIAAR